MSPMVNYQRADVWKRNALFRVLAFLDNTGAQAFDLVEDTSGAAGKFTHGEITFGEGTSIARILQSVLDALRANIARLFTNADEQNALLEYFGRGSSPSDETSTLIPPQAMTPLAQMEASALAPSPHSTDVGAPHRHLATSTLPRTTPLCEALLHPASLTAAARAIEDALPLHLYSRLTEVLGVPPSQPDSCHVDSPLLEQLFIDGIDRWMAARTLPENRQLVLACGVQPSLVDQVCLRPHDEATRLLVDFVADVVFPPRLTVSRAHSATIVGDLSSDNADKVLDWVLLSYEKNHETVDVEDEESDTSDALGIADAGVSSAARDGGLGGWAPDEGEVVLTEENIDEYMRTHPEWIPVEVVREKRRAWTDPAVTPFELNHHYAVAELKDIVQRLLSTVDDPAARTEVEARLTRAVSSDVLSLARCARRKADFVAVILALHAGSGNGRDKDNEQSTAAAVTPVGAKARQMQESVVDTSLSVKEMERRYTLAQLKGCLSASFPDQAVPATKQKCAKLIKSCAKGESKV